MTLEAQQAAIEEACGWKRYKNPGDIRWHWTRPGEDFPFAAQYDDQPSPTPKYLTDLNAMHEAEKTLGPLLHSYWGYLWDVVNPTLDFHRTRFHWDWADFDRFANATAAQRAEAFLRVKGLWRDS